jgi:hypothetical protein
MSDHFLTLAKKRRTIYALEKDIKVPEAEIINTIKEAVKQAPSAFNSQSSRVVILLGKEHTRFWELTREQLKKIVPAEKFQVMSDKVDGFAAAAGSVLFFEDQEVVKTLLITSLCGLNTVPASLSMPCGWHWPKKGSAPICNTTIRWLTTTYVPHGTFLNPGSCVHT